MKTSRYLLVGFAALATVSCTTLGKRIGEPLSDTHDRFDVGTADAQSIVAMLGPPTRMSALPGGMVMLYEYLDGTERQIGINLEYIALDFLKIAVGRGTASREALVLTFDDAGVLRSRIYRSWTDDVGRGGTVQLFFVALPTVDASYLREPATQHAWGQHMLRPLPETLNEDQDITNGEHGLELLGSPDGAGQRTLEMQQANRRSR